jgi:hypothetical protein
VTHGGTKVGIVHLPIAAARKKLRVGCNGDNSGWESNAMKRPEHHNGGGFSPCFRRDELRAVTSLLPSIYDYAGCCFGTTTEI